MNNIENLTRFVESGIADNKMLKKASILELKESLSRCVKKLRESLDSEASEGWWVPISFYNKVNGNNRNYNRQLWENVVNNQKDIYVGSPMLTDHPEGDSDGNPRDICGVWLDAKIDPPSSDGSGLVWGLLVPSGRLGDDLKDHIKHGLKVGTSSSGFGKLLNDGITVDPDSYQIERLADFVLNPSQGTFFSYDESDDYIKDNSIRESIKNTQESKFKENIVKDSKIAKLEEKKFRRDMESFLESADNIKDPQEKLEEFKEIRSYLEDGACPDLREKIEEKVAAQEKLIKDMLNDSTEYREKFGIESPKDLEEKLTQLVEDTRVIESESENWKSIAEKLQEKYSKVKEDLENRPTENYVKYIESKNSKLNEKLISENKKASEIVKNLIESCEKVKNNNEDLTKEVEDLKKEKECLEARIEADSNFQTAAVDADASNIKTYTDLQQAFEESQKRLEEILKVVKSQNKEILNQRDLITSYKEKNRLQFRAIEELKEKNRRILHENNRLASEYEGYIRDAELENADPVELYYEELQDIYGDEINLYRSKILSAPTLSEAKQIFYKDVFQRLENSKEIEDSRMPRTSYLQEKRVSKTTMIDRKPKGWV